MNKTLMLFRKYQLEVLQWSPAIFLLLLIGAIAMGKWVLLIGLTGLFLTTLTLKINIESRNINMLSDIFKEIKSLEEKLHTEFKDKKEDWDSLFFNTIEYLSFLMNRQYVYYKDFEDFFGDAIIDWYEHIFSIYYKADRIENPKIYPEMKKLYNLLKEKKAKCEAKS